MLSAAQHRSKQSGFTLLELLVVLLIIGVVVSMVTFSVGGNEARALKDEAQRLASLLDLLSQESVLKGQQMAVEVSDNGYRFYVNDGENWVPLSGGNEFRPRELPAGMELSAEVEGQVEEEDDFGEKNAVRVWFMSSGEVSPFNITLTLDESRVYYRLEGDLMGQLKLEGPLTS